MSIDDVIEPVEWWRFWRRSFMPTSVEILREWNARVHAAVSTEEGEVPLFSGMPTPELRWRPSQNLEASIRSIEANRTRIVIDLGIYALVHDCCYRLFSASDLMRTFGEPEREVGSLVELARQRSWRREPWLPRCKIRESACFITAECAIALLIYHEMGHAARGHLSNGPNFRCFHERVRHHVSSPRPKPFERLDEAVISQREELEADRFAVALAGFFVKSSGGLFPSHHVIDELKDRLAELLLVGQLILHALLCDTGLSVSAFAQASHPHPIARLLDGVATLTHAQLLTDTAQIASAGDAIRVIQALRGNPWTPEFFAEEQREARSQLEALYAKSRS